MNYGSSNNDMLYRLLANKSNALNGNGFGSNQNMLLANGGASQSKGAKGWGGFMGATSGMQGQGGFVSGNDSIDDQTQQKMNGLEIEYEFSKKTDSLNLKNILTGFR